MPDIVITPNRGTTSNPKIDFTGVTTGTIKLEVLADGTIAWNGANGSLFSIADSLSGSLMSVNDISGLPAFEVFSDNRVVVGQFGARLGIGTVNPTSTAKLHIAGLNTAPPNVFLQTTNSSANGGIFWRNNSNATTSAIASNYNVSDASGNIEFLSGGANTRMVVASGGNVGIGTTAPLYKFVVSNSGNLGFEIDPTASSGSQVSVLAYDRVAAVYRKLGFNASEFHFNTGNVGIGTTSPGNKLQITGGDASTATVKVNAPIYPIIEFTSDNADVNNRNWRIASVYSAYGKFEILSGTSSGALATTNRFTIDGGTGNVGVGTTSPNYKLHVSGTGYVSGALTSGGRIAATGATCELYLDSGASNSTITSYGSGVYKDLWIRTLSSSSDGVWIKADTGRLGVGVAAPSEKLEVNGNILAGNSVGNNSISVTRTGANSSSLAIQAFTDSPAINWNGAGGYFRFIYGVTEQMRLDSSGNVGIGTTTPAYKLDVAGTANAIAAKIGAASQYLTIGSYTPNSAGVTLGYNTTQYVGLNAFFGVLVGRTYVSNNSTAPADGMIIQGNLGVGTTSPSSKLDVNGVVKDQYGDLRTLPENAKTAAYVLAASDTGRLINITTGGITVNSGIFSVGQAVTIYNNSAANQTITQGTSVTMYLAGSATTGNRTLAQRGLASVICVATNTFVISGSGLT